jgi:hypothetical protein
MLVQSRREKYRLEIINRQYNPSFLSLLVIFVCNRGNMAIYTTPVFLAPETLPVSEDLVTISEPYRQFGAVYTKQRVYVVATACDARHAGMVGHIIISLT